MIFINLKTEYVESEKIVNSVENTKERTLYSIQYNHIIIDNKKKNIIIFDSKYFNNKVGVLNYK